MKADDVKQIAVVGAGRMGLGHLEQLLQLPDLAAVVAGGDPFPAARQGLENEYGSERTYAELVRHSKK